MKVQDYLAKHTSIMGKTLANFVLTTDQSKLDWLPGIEGSQGVRSIHDQLKECIVVNNAFVKRLQGIPTPPPMELVGDVHFASPEDARNQLIASAEALASVIIGLDDDQIVAEVDSPRGKMSAADACMLPIRNMAYHSGQVNLFQMLLGDAEFHLPA